MKEKKKRNKNPVSKRRFSQYSLLSQYVYTIVFSKSIQPVEGTPPINLTLRLYIYSSIRFVFICWGREDNS